MCIYPYTCGSQGKTMGSLLRHHPSYCLRQALFLAWNSTSRLGWVASDPWGSAWLCFPSQLNISTCRHMLLFLKLWTLRIERMSLCLPKPSPQPLTRKLRPLHFLTNPCPFSEVLRNLHLKGWTWKMLSTERSLHTVKPQSPVQDLSLPERADRDKP